MGREWGLARWRLLALDSSLPEWRRWMISRMVEMSMTRSDLEKATGLSAPALKGALNGRSCPRNGTWDAIQTVLGAAPEDVALSWRTARPYVDVVEHPDDAPGTLAAWVRRERLARGLSQEELGKKLGSTGSTISMTEAGQRVSEKPRIERLVEILGPMPLGVSRQVRAAKDSRAKGMRVGWQEKVRQWKRPRLVQQIEKLGQNANEYLKDVDYNGAVGKAGYDAYMKALAARMRASPNWHYGIGPAGKRPGARLRGVLNALEGVRLK
jgi:transcriptional regulator with XRE-family HTH domain